MAESEPVVPKRRPYDEMLLSFAGPPGSERRLHAEAVCDAHRLLEEIELRGAYRKSLLEKGYSEEDVDEILSELSS